MVGMVFGTYVSWVEVDFFGGGVGGHVVVSTVFFIDTIMSWEGTVQFNHASIPWLDKSRDGLPRYVQLPSPTIKCSSKQPIYQLPPNPKLPIRKADNELFLAPTTHTHLVI